MFVVLAQRNHRKASARSGPSEGGSSGVRPLGDGVTNLSQTFQPSTSTYWPKGGMHGRFTQLIVSYPNFIGKPW